MKKEYFCTLLFSIIFYGSVAQFDRSLFVRSVNINGVHCTELKWYSPDLTYPDGVKIYRRETGTFTWLELTDRVIKSRSPGQEELESDEDLAFFTEIIANQNKQVMDEGFLMLNILVKSFKQNEFADILGIFYRDTTVEAGKTYEYRVNKIRGDREVLVAISDPVTVSDQKVPVDYNFTLRESKEGVAFDWSVDESSYYGINLYFATDSIMGRKINNNPVILTQSEDSTGIMRYPDPKFLYKKARNKIRYSFWIRGAGYFGEELTASDTLTVTIGDYTPPPSPKNIEGKADSMNVRLNWQRSVSEDLSEQMVYRSTLSDGPFEKIHRCFSCDSFTDTIHVPGPYYYQIAALDHSGNTSYSRKIFIEVQDVIPPAPPQNLLIESDTGQLILQWKENTEPDLAGYYLYRTVTENDPEHYVFLNSEPLDTSYYVQDLPKITKNTFYYYAIAVDTSYNRSKPSEVAAGTLPDVLPPHQPFILNVRHTKAGIRITWKPVLDPDLAGYELYRSDSTTLLNFQKVHEKILSRADTTYLDPIVKPGVDYLYQLVARDSAGNASPPSTPFYYLSPASDDLSDVRIMLKINYKKHRQEARLRWETAGNTEELLGYVVYSSADAVRLRPVTGLLKANRWTESLSEEEDPYYQIRMYFRDGRCYRSEVMKVK